MVKRKERKLEYSFEQKEKGIKNKDAAYLCGIGVRWFQKLYSQYKMTGKVPELKWNRRPKTHLSKEQEELVDKAIKESELRSSVHLRLYIQRYFKVTLPNNKIHRYLLKKGIAEEDEKKKRQRIYRLYERDHSFSLGHLDWHVSKCIPGKQVCVFIDDASRNVIVGDEYDQALEIYNIALVKQAIKIADKKYSSVIREVNTDKGPQFYANKKDIDGEKGLTEFELFLAKNNIKHIPSRRNHPQTNGKNERWFRTYEENRGRYKTFKEFVDWYNDKINLGLSRKIGITPNDAIGFKLQPEAILGLFFRRFE